MNYMLSSISIGGIIGIVVAAVLVIVVIAILISGYNKFVKKRNKCQEAFATMDVYMKKRYDLIPNLVECVKGYAKHEKGTLSAVIQARNLAQDSGSVSEKVKNENILNDTLKSLFALGEAYPDLKANVQFMDLQRQLQSVEEDIAKSRTYYNAIVNDYNTAVESFPNNIVANMFKFKRMPLFEIDGTMRENVDIKFE